MKIRLKTGFGIFTALVLTLWSCEEPVEDQAYGISKIYMPQAGINLGADNNYYNELNPGGEDTSIILGIYRSGLAALEEATVDLEIDTDTLEAALAYSETPDGSGDAYHYYRNGHLLNPDYYTLPDHITIPDGQREATVELTINKEAIYNDPAWVDDFFILPVRISNPTRYELNEDLSLTMVIIKRNFETVDVTADYLTNYSEPFEYSEWDGSRWGTLAGWTSNDDIKNAGGYGGYEWRNGTLGVLSMEAGWGLPAVPNGKIYQTFSLPAGFYTFEVELESNGSAGTKYMVVSEGDTLPDFSNIADESVVYTDIANQSITFYIGEETEISLGFVCNLPGNGEYVKVLKVSLLNLK
jgi:hypothetical protein